MRNSVPSDDDDRKLARLIRAFPETSSQREDRVLRTAAALIQGGIRDPEYLVHRFAVPFGDPDHIAPTSRVEWDLSQAQAGILTGHIRITSGSDFDKLDDLGWIAQEDRNLRQYLRDQRAHRSHLDQATIVRTLAVHYLSRAGGGRCRRLDDAAHVYEASRPASEAGLWDYDRHKVVMRTLRRDFGLAA